VDTACVTFNKTWIADSYIVNGFKYISGSSVTLIYVANSPTEGSYQIFGTDAMTGDPIDENGTYSYNLDNLNMSHTYDGSTYYLSVDKFNNELDVSGGETGFTISLKFYSL
tara:strand:- start:202 stop:534 length:333 start_codon:yes stop_codon:yes gene_type:complete